MVYFIGSKEHDYVKIGHTVNNPKGRLVKLSVDCPLIMTLLYSMNGTQILEKKLHSMFKEQHIRGEWFRLSGPIQNYIDSEPTGIR